MFDPAPTAESLDESFVGRTRERRLMAAAAARATEGTPQIVVVTGDSGMGKSALVDVVRTELSTFTVLDVEGDEGAMHQPWAVICRLAEQVGAPGMTTGPTTTFSAASWLVSLLERLQANGPVALLLDDLHWVDRESAGAFAVAARRLSAGDRVLVVVTTRPPLAPRAWRQMVEEQPETSFLVELEGLRTPEVAELARRERVRLPRRGDQRLRDHTGGVPLHVRALLREYSAQTWRSRSGLPAPRMYAMVVDDRLAALPPAARAVASALAVLQQRSALSVVAHVADVSEPAEAVEPAVHAGLVKLSRTDAAAPLRLAHPLIGAAIRQVLPPGVRRALHRRASEVVAGPAGVEHRVAAAERFDAGLADELTAMADAAHEQRRLDLAAQYRQWAADLCDDVGVREQRLLDSWYEMLLDGNAQAVASEVDTIRAMQPHPKIDLVLGALATQEGKPDEALRHVKAALSDEAVRQDATLTARLCCELGWANFYAGRPAEDLLASIELLGDAAPHPADVHEAVAVLTALGGGLITGASAMANRLTTPQPPPQEPTSETPRQPDLLVVRGCMHVARGKPSQAVVDLSRAVMHYRSGLPSRLIGLGFSHLALARWLLGDWTHAREAALLARETTDGADAAAASAYSVLPAATKGDFAAAKRYLARATEIVDTTQHPERVAAWNIAGFQLADVTSDLRLLRNHLDHPLTPIVYQRMRAWQADWWLISYAQALLDAGRADQAAAVADELPLATDLGAGVRMMLTRLRGSLARRRSDHRRALAIYEAVRHGESDDAMPFFEAHLRHDHGRLLVLLGDQRAGVEQLRAARRIYHQLGALPYLHRTGQELAVVSTESDDGRQAASLLQSLTERERDIALLAARGLTNREIAEQLFVTSKTVEFHLSNIYAKCGVSNRRELRHRLGGG